MLHALLQVLTLPITVRYRGKRQKCKRMCKEIVCWIKLHGLCTNAFSLARVLVFMINNKTKNISGLLSF